MKLPAEFKN